MFHVVCYVGDDSGLRTPLWSRTIFCREWQQALWEAKFWECACIGKVRMPPGAPILHHSLAQLLIPEPKLSLSGTVTCPFCSGHCCICLLIFRLCMHVLFFQYYLPNIIWGFTFLLLLAKCIATSLKSRKYGKCKPWARWWCLVLRSALKSINTKQKHGLWLELPEKRPLSTLVGLETVKR